MRVTIEQVEKLQKRANVSYEEAKEALEECDGDILEALIRLEKDGKTAECGGGSYKTNQQAGYNDAGNNGNQNSYNQNYNNQNYDNQGYYQGYNNRGYSDQNNQQGPNMNYNYNGQQSSNFGKQANSVWKSFCRLLHKGNVNHFVVTKDEREVVRMPVNLLIILLIAFNAATLILLIVLLFFGFKYSFEGPDLGKNSINNVMDCASNTADDIKQSAKDAAADDPNSRDSNNSNNQ